MLARPPESCHERDMVQLFKNVWPFAAAAFWWIADKLWGNQLYGLISQYIPQTIVDLPYLSARDALTWVPPALFVVLGVVLHSRTQRFKQAPVWTLQSQPPVPIAVAPLPTNNVHSGKKFIALADKERISDALVAISKTNNAIVNPLFNAAGKLYVPWHNLNSHIDSEFAKQTMDEASRLVEEIRKAKVSFYDEISKEYSDYPNDLKDILLNNRDEGAHPLNMLSLALENFIGAVQIYIDLSQKPPITIGDNQKLLKLIHPTADKVHWGVAETVSWSEFMKDRIKRKRESLAQ